MQVELKFIMDDDTQCRQTLVEMLRDLQFDKFRLAEQMLNDTEYFYVIHATAAGSETSSSRPVLLFTSTKEDWAEFDNCLVFNDELFAEKRESVNIVEYVGAEANLTPNFWLILSFSRVGKSTFAWLYYHSRQNMHLYGLEIFNKLRVTLEKTVKKINQTVLLDRLNMTRECDDLLITVEDKDPYTKTNIRSQLNSTPVSHFNIEPELEIAEDRSFKLVKKNFPPGSFTCEIVWDKHFVLHPRLHGKDGLATIRSVLSSFMVTNRNNLFVYKEKGGSVFYLRLYEIECDWHTHQFEKFSISISESSSVMADFNNCYFDNIISSNELLHDSLRVDSDRDTDSIVSANNLIKPMDRLNYQCILLNVHGVDPPGDYIKVDMVGALQKRLDEAVLENLILMLARNPLSKFTIEDVSFIQSPNSSFENFFFVINETYLPNLPNIKAYLRQNLSIFMYNPKYTDANSEYHFKLFKNEEFHCVLDEDIFIYSCQQESGRDSRGVACVILSIVSKEKIAPNLVSSFAPIKSDMTEIVFCNFDNITNCYALHQESSNARFYIHFQVWSSGKIDIEHLKARLIEAIRQSLWDFNIEFNIFKITSLEDSRHMWHSNSEPSTPKKTSDKRGNVDNQLVTVSTIYRRLHFLRTKIGLDHGFATATVESTRRHCNGACPVDHLK